LAIGAGYNIEQSRKNVRTSDITVTEFGFIWLNNLKYVERRKSHFIQKINFAVLLDREACDGRGMQNVWVKAEGYTGFCGETRGKGTTWKSQTYMVE